MASLSNERRGFVPVPWTMTLLELKPAPLGWLWRADCTGDIVLSGGQQFGIESPVHVDCDFQLGICDWNITDNTTLWDKVTIMDVNKTFKGFTNWTDDVIAIVWLDSKTRRWSTLRNMSGTGYPPRKADFIRKADLFTYFVIVPLSLIGFAIAFMIVCLCCNIKQRRRTMSQTHNRADSEYLNFLTIRENTPRIAKDREELIVTYDPSVESFESSAVDSSPEDKPNMNSSRQQSPMYPTQECLPQVPTFTGSNLASIDRFYQAMKIHNTAFFGRKVKSKSIIPVSSWNVKYPCKVGYEIPFMQKMYVRSLSLQCREQ
uniref:Uncharacterized protein n=1 Tax=Timema poppense TaxID=170557 RepID=A0A7R9HBP0_TIMPO|nr:unnamed protein product [Timema poppensis]